MVLLCVVLMLMASCVSAFPLSGGNGQINATVLGIFQDDGTLYLDILFPANYYVDSPNADTTKVTLVDSEDKFYDMSGGPSGSGSSVGDQDRKSPRRLFSSSSVPQKAEIKRVRIAPAKGDPFSIEWTGVPEVKGPSVSMKFYGPTTPPGYDPSERTLMKDWGFDVKITNIGTQKQSIGNDQFEVVDQFGFHYGGITSSEMVQGPSFVDLMPGESMRFTVVIERVSKLSRPVYLTHLPSNLTMDISAWT